MIEERIIYKKIIKKHRCLVYVLILLHVYIIFSVCKNSYQRVINSSENIICSHAYLIKNITYVFLNVILMLYLIDSVNSRRTLVSSINYF